VTSAADAQRLLGELVSVTRDGFREHRTVAGYLVAASPSWLVLHQVSDRFDLDGYACYRTQDLTALGATAPRLEVIRRAMRIKALSPSSPGSLALEGTRELMASAQALHEVLVIERERRDPLASEVGRLRLDGEQLYALHGLSRDGFWEPDERVFRYEDVTRVAFAGEYERTLAALAGPPPGGERVSPDDAPSDD
jgi:hypothetical protein